VCERKAKGQGSVCERKAKENGRVCERERKIWERLKSESVSDKFTREMHREREKEAKYGSGKAENVCERGKWQI